MRIGRTDGRTISMTPAVASHPGLPPVPRLDARAVTYVCGLYFLSRLLILAIAAVSHQVVESGPFPPGGHTWIERFFAWDSTWYLGIAQNGYFYDLHQASSVEFYPLLPMLMRVVGFTGLDLRLCGYLITHGALIVGSLLLWRLAAWETRSGRIAERAVLFFLFCPGAMWFGLIYTESLFFLTQVGCLLCARRGRWLTAGLWGLASALTRTPGLLLAGFLFLEGAQQWWERRTVTHDPLPDGAGGSPRAAGLPWLARVALGVSGPLIGHASYLAFLQLRFGDWRAQQKAMAVGWNGGNGLLLPWTALVDQWNRVEPFIVDVSMPLLAITVVLAFVSFFTLRRVSYVALVLTLCVLYVSATPGDANTRYLSATAPTYLVLAQLADRSRLLETAVLVFSVALMTLLTILLINGYRIN